MTLRTSVLGLIVIVVFVITACGDADNSRGNFDPGPNNLAGHPSDDRGPGPTPDPRMQGERLHGIWPQVWSQHAPGVRSWEYKVNCGLANSHTEPCFLSDLTAVNVEAPDGSLTELDFDFNTNEYSGEVTRRWVKYGPPEGTLPEPGDYIFRYWRGDELAYEQAVPYSSEVISYPMDVTWWREGDNIHVNWTPPPEAGPTMHYKAIIWQVDDSPPVTVSRVFDWAANSGVLEDVPLREGGEYSLNVAIFFPDGYAYSEYVIFDWEGT